METFKWASNGIFSILLLKIYQFFTTNICCEKITVVNAH